MKSIHKSTSKHQHRNVRQKSQKSYHNRSNIHHKKVLLKKPQQNTSSSSLYFLSNMHLQHQHQRFVTFYPEGSPSQGITYQSIEQKITSAVPSLTFYNILNESNQHSGPPNRESHFKLTLVANWKDLGLPTLVKRHRFINDLLRDEVSNGVHALSLHMFTNEEWAKRDGQAPQSPGCASKKHQNHSNDI